LACDIFFYANLENNPDLVLRSLAVLSIMEHLKKEVVMKSIEIDDDLYAFIASQTKHIGESASQILRRLLLPEDGAVSNSVAPSTTPVKSAVENTSAEPTKNAQASEVETTNTVTLSSDKKPQSKNAQAASQTAARTTSPKASTKKTTAKKAPASRPVVAATKKASTAKAAADTVTATHDKRDILDAVSKDALSTFSKRVDQFLFVLSAAHKLNADSFANVESIKGKNRTYFATSKDALLENGSSTNPKAIPDSPFWVVTNNNTAKKTNMLEQVLRNLGYQPDVIETVVARFSSEGK
jgi:negative modulator of initiation of replication